mgnify:CR=1 FL=1
MDIASKKETLIEFPKGIPGFEEYKTFKLIEDEEDHLLANLLAIEDGQAGFVLFRIQLFLKEYLPQIELVEEEAKLLEIEQTDNLEVWTILTLCRSDLTKTTANLRAPVIINRRTRKGAQFVLNDDRYSARYPLFAGLTASCNHNVERQQERG